MNYPALEISSEQWLRDEGTILPGHDPVNILVVDDLPEKLLAYEVILQELGQNVVKVRSGEEALRVVLRQEFAVILLDVNMPGMDGFETASLIRKRKKSAHTPIIFLTAFTDEIRMAQGYASGAVDYLPTPVVPEILQAKVKVFIELSQMRSKAALQAEERAMRTAAEESARRSDFLVRASGILARSPNQEEILSVIAKIPVPYLADVSMLWFNKKEPHHSQMEQAWITPEKEVCSAPVPSSFAAFSELEKAIQKVLTTNQFQLLSHIPMPVISSPGRVSCAEGEVLSSTQGVVLILPLTLRAETSGVLILTRRSARAKYEPGEISLASDLASRISIALENTTLMEKIRDADQRKDEFLAMLAHELRNPLAPIHNALHIMKLTKDADIRRQSEETIERQLKHMVHLVDDLTDISRITQGKIELRKEKMQFKDAFDHAVETAQPLITQRGHTLTIALPDEAVWLEADPARISQIFSNLLNNAAKYTDNGGHIKVKAQLDAGWLVISISDDGIGIATHMLPRIFDMFSQVDSSLERTQGGLGIGLTLVKSLVEMHGGTINAHSDGLKKGSEFTICLPVVSALEKESAENTDKATHEELPSSLRMLVVDDNEASAKTIGWMMELLGQEVRTAYNGRDAIEIARTYHPQVILLDIGLPGMNGYEVCKAMHSDPSLKNSVFIAQTGWGQSEHRQRSKEAGFDHHLVKPIDLKVLEELLSKITQTNP